MLELEHISVRFAAGHGVQAVEDVTLTLEDGGRLAIVGETGSGKKRAATGCFTAAAGKRAGLRQRPAGRRGSVCRRAEAASGNPGRRHLLCAPGGVEPA